MINYYAVVIEDEVKLIIPWSGDEYPTLEQISSYLSHLYPPPFSFATEPLVEKVGMMRTSKIAGGNCRPGETPFKPIKPKAAAEALKDMMGMVSDSPHPDALREELIERKTRE